MHQQTERVSFLPKLTSLFCIFNSGQRCFWVSLTISEYCLKMYIYKNGTVFIRLRVLRGQIHGEWNWNCTIQIKAIGGSSEKVNIAKILRDRNEGNGKCVHVILINKYILILKKFDMCLTEFMLWFWHKKCSCLFSGSL